MQIHRGLLGLGQPPKAGLVDIPLSPGEHWDTPPGRSTLPKAHSLSPNLETNYNSYGGNTRLILQCMGRHAHQYERTYHVYENQCVSSEKDHYFGKFKCPLPRCGWRSCLWVSHFHLAQRVLKFG